MARHLNKFLDQYSLTVIDNTDFLLHEMGNVIGLINQQLYASGLYTFTILAAMKPDGTNCVFDIQAISQDRFGEIKDRKMFPIRAWKQRYELYQYLLENVHPVE